MNINNILSVFTPKDTKFLPLLQESAAIMINAAHLLQELFSHTEESQVGEAYKLIKAEELKGDKVTGKIMKALNETFITPFDKEDINALADEMDDVIDAINRAALKVLLYSPRRVCVTTLEMTDIIIKGTSEVHEAVKDLTHLKDSNQNIRLHYKEIKKLEEAGDAIYEKGTMILFKEESDTTELIKQKEIIQELEKTVNKINNIGKVLKTIFVKYT